MPFHFKTELPPLEKHVCVYLTRSFIELVFVLYIDEHNSSIWRQHQFAQLQNRYMHDLIGHMGQIPPRNWLSHTGAVVFVVNQEDSFFQNWACSITLTGPQIAFLHLGYFQTWLHLTAIYSSTYTLIVKGKKLLVSIYQWFFSLFHFDRAEWVNLSRQVLKWVCQLVSDKIKGHG